MDIDKATPLETREKIFKSALDLFSEKGYDSSSISEICRKAEITKGALYWHFKDKLDLYKQLIELILQGIMKDSHDFLIKEKSPFEKIRKFNIRLLTLVETQDFYQKSLLMFLRELRSERVSDLHKSIEILTDKYKFELRFKEAIAAKEISDSLTPSEYIDLYKSIITSLVINWLVRGKSFDLAKRGEKYFEFMFR